MNKYKEVPLIYPVCAYMRVNKRRGFDKYVANVSHVEHTQVVNNVPCIVYVQLILLTVN